jgi:hypothetical protein
MGLILRHQKELLPPHTNKTKNSIEKEMKGISQRRKRTDQTKKYVKRSHEAESNFPRQGDPDQ